MIDDTVRWLPEGRAEQIEQAIESLVAGGARSLLLLAGKDAPLSAQNMDPLLRRVSVPIFGGVFPSVIYDAAYSASGAIVVGLAHRPQVCEVVALGPDLLRSARRKRVGDKTDRLASVMIWIDGQAAHLADCIEAVYDVYGSGPSYIGAGAGTRVPGRRACLFSNRGMLQDVALILGFSERIGVGVEHGWQVAAGPFIVSEASGNWVHALDYRPAFEVYRSVVGPLCGGVVSEDNFLEVAQSFPFGLDRMDGSVAVREPIEIRDGGMVCVGEVPSQTTMHILRGHPSSVKNAARDGSKRALDRSVGALAVALIVSCFAREEFLGAEYADEIATARSVLDENGHQAVPLVGVLSMGEIANPGNRYLELFSKTFVLGLLPHAGT